MTNIDLTHLSEYFPWSEVYDDLGYAMPYPEVLMTSDRAYAFQTQVAGLLMMQSWGDGNRATYAVEQAEASHEAYMVELVLELPTIDEAWELIGVPTEKLMSYMKTAMLRYVSSKALPQKSFRIVPLDEGKYMFVSATE